MPAVIIRLIDALATIADATYSAEQRRVLLRQAAATVRSARASVSEPSDLDAIEAHYERLIDTVNAGDPSSSPTPGDATT